MMIFYYTGTGNSLAIAKQLGGELVSIPKIMNSKDLSFKADVIGIVFPIYSLEAPKKVQEFLSKARFKADYMFAIGTYGSMPSAAMYRVQKLAKKNGYCFDYLNQILMVDNFLPLFDIDKEIKKIPQKKINENLLLIKDEIESRKKREAHASLGHRALAGTLSAFGKLLYNGKEAQKYIVNDQCIKCGICTKVCPASNITVEEKVTFKASCEQCEACVHMCPKNAIHIKNERSKARWINPEVTLNEIIESNNQK